MAHLVARYSPLLFAALLVAACADNPTVEAYDVRGRVVGFAFGGEAVVIDHEAIDGYMPAMRMTLRPEDRALIDDLGPGDAVAFRLVVPEAGSSYIDQVETLPPGTALDLAPPDTSGDG